MVLQFDPTHALLERPEKTIHITAVLMVSRRYCDQALRLTSHSEQFRRSFLGDVFIGSGGNHKYWKGRDSGHEVGTLEKRRLMRHSFGERCRDVFPMPRQDILFGCPDSE